MLVNNLPTSTLKFKIYHCHLVSYVLKCAPKAISSLLDPIQFRWEIVDGKLKSKGTDQLPAPTEMLELSSLNIPYNILFIIHH